MGNLIVCKNLLEKSILLVGNCFTSDKMAQREVISIR